MTTETSRENKCDKYYSVDFILSQLDKMIEDEKYLLFIQIYDRVKEHSHLENVKKLINKKNIHKSLNQTYTCDVCNIDMKNNYKPLHEKTKKHLMCLQKIQESRIGSSSKKMSDIDSDDNFE